MVKQWDYVGNYRIGIYDIAGRNPMYARFVCPHTEEVKEVKIEDGDLW